jgi:hypothetical protein
MNFKAEAREDQQFIFWYVEWDSRYSVRIRTPRKICFVGKKNDDL